MDIQSTNDLQNTIDWLTKVINSYNENVERDVVKDSTREPDKDSTNNSFSNSSNELSLVKRQLEPSLVKTSSDNDVASKKPLKRKRSRSPEYTPLSSRFDTCCSHTKTIKKLNTEVCDLLYDIGKYRATISSLRNELVVSNKMIDKLHTKITDERKRYHFELFRKCFYYAKNGRCIHGSNCKFEHSDPF